MNKGSKNLFPLFFPSLSGYIYSGSLWFGTMPHANYKRWVSFDLWDLGCWIWAITETKSFGFQGYAKNRRVHLLKPKRKKLLLIKKLESLDASLCEPITFLSHTSATIVRYNKWCNGQNVGTMLPPPRVRPIIILSHEQPPRSLASVTNPLIRWWPEKKKQKKVIRRRSAYGPTIDGVFKKLRTCVFSVEP